MTYEHAGNSPDSTHYSSCGEWDRLSCCGNRSSVEGFETPRGGYDTDGSFFSRSSIASRRRRPFSSNGVMNSGNIGALARVSNSSGTECFGESIKGKPEGEGDGDVNGDSASDQNSEFDSYSEFDSMFGDATDDEESAAATSRVTGTERTFCNLKSHKYHNDGLLLNSEVCFGAGDWDEYADEVDRLERDERSTDDRNINMQIDVNGCTSLKPNEENTQESIVNEDAPSNNRSQMSGIPRPEQEDVLSIDLHERDKDFWRQSNGLTSVVLEQAQSLHKDHRDTAFLYSQKPHMGSYYSFPFSEELSNESCKQNGAAALSDKGESNLKNCALVLSKDVENDGLHLQIQNTVHELETSEETKKTHPLEVAEHRDSPSYGHGRSQIKVSKNWDKDDLGPDELSRYVEELDVNESYVDTVLDMEEVLLDSGVIRAKFGGTSRSMAGQGHKFQKDESSVPSTPGMEVQTIFKFDYVEIVGAKQRRGASFGERLVGVKEYTVYQIKVYSGKFHWEVERRYRDFDTLYRQLKKSLAAQGITDFPPPWNLVEKESYKIFGNVSPTVVSERSNLIQECLVALIRAGSPFDSASPLFWFLLPQRSSSNIYSGSEQHQLDNMQVALNGIDYEVFSPDGISGNELENAPRNETSDFGKTIRLIVHMHPQKSLRQLLESQHNSCAGCYRRFDVAKSLVQEFAQTFGWGKPRFCEYTGQLFCTSCHLNETAVLPARVLNNWHFTLYPVSQLAKAYLDSIYDQPMLCVSAVNPFLFSRVPLLVYVVEMRRKLSSMLCYVRCASRANIQQGVGSRKYLLENNDFFALRDLVDLSKGAFSALPSRMETLLKKMYSHITKCSTCREGGQQCGFQSKCFLSSGLIFPFQETEQCKHCGVLFHQSCCRKFGGCQCSVQNPRENKLDIYTSRGSRLPADDVEPANNDSLRPFRSFSNISLSNHESTSRKGFFMDLLGKATPNIAWKLPMKSSTFSMTLLSSSQPRL